MSHTNITENYKLPQFIGTDIPDWLTDVNTGYFEIDAGMKANKVLASTANEKADNNTTSIQLLNERVDRISDDCGESDTNIRNLEQTVELHTTHLNEIDTINRKNTADIEALQTTQTEQGQDISAIQINTDKITGIEQNLNTLTSSIETEIDSLDNRVVSIEDAIPNFAQKYTLSSKYPQVEPASGELFGVTRCVAKAVIDKNGATIGWYIDSLLLTNFTGNKQLYAFNLTLPEDLLWVEYMGNGGAQLTGDVSDSNINTPVLLGIGVNRGSLPARTKTMVMFVPETWETNADVKITQKLYF